MAWASDLCTSAISTNIFFYILPCMMQKIYDADYYSTRRMQRDDINEIHAEKKIDVTDMYIQSQ